MKQVFSEKEFTGYESDNRTTVSSSTDQYQQEEIIPLEVINKESAINRTFHESR